jgi:cysteine desulfurase
LGLPSRATLGRHYLDHASTSPIRPEAARAVSDWIENGPEGDPGRVHAEGREVRAAIEAAREQVAALVGTIPSRVVFTSGGTEAANAAVFAAVRARPGARIVASAVEHSAVREASLRAAAVDEWRVDRSGRVDLDHLDEILAGGDKPALVNCQWCNHEVGTTQPVEQVVARCSAAGVPVHIDACAAAGHLEVSLEGLGADLVSISGHKLGGPPGVGALVVRRGLRLEPFVTGGSQERARRGGFENVLGIVGFGAAAEVLSDRRRLEQESEAARSRTEAMLLAATAVEGVVPLGDTVLRAPHIVCVSVGGVRAEAVLLQLDRDGIAAHSGSACSSEAIEPSPVLAAMGVDAEQSLRLSVGWSTTDGDVEAFSARFPAAVRSLRALGDAKPTGAAL